MFWRLKALNLEPAFKLDQLEVGKASLAPQRGCPAGDPAACHRCCLFTLDQRFLKVYRTLSPKLTHYARLVTLDRGHRLARMLNVSAL
jgi:hypothetical protein